jgi:hypothetical protein
MANTDTHDVDTTRRHVLPLIEQITAMLGLRLNAIDLE